MLFGHYFGFVPNGSDVPTISRRHSNVGFSLCTFQKWPRYICPGIVFMLLVRTTTVCCELQQWRRRDVDVRALHSHDKVKSNAQATHAFFKFQFTVCLGMKPNKLTSLVALCFSLNARKLHRRGTLLCVSQLSK